MRANAVSACCSVVFTHQCNANIPSLTSCSVTIFSILRLSMLVELYFFPRVGDWSYKIGFVYSTVECNLAIISASVPALHNFTKQWLPRKFKSSQGASGASGASGDAIKAGSPGSSGARHGTGRSQPDSVRANGVPVTLRDMRGRGQRGYHTRLDSLTNSEEEILSERKITRTTEVEVRYDNRV